MFLNVKNKSKTCDLLKKQNERLKNTIVANQNLVENFQKESIKYQTIQMERDDLKQKFKLLQLKLKTEKEFKENILKNSQELRNQYNEMNSKYHSQYLELMHSKTKFEVTLF